MKEVALYIHVPFCKQKCLYCDFPSYASKDHLMDEYVEALVLDIKNNCKKYKFKSLFIGGGTPSYLDENLLEKLMKAICELDFLEGAEKSIECNPGTLTKAKLEILKKYGMNRISMGLQTTKNHLLKSIGRIHSFEEFKENYYLARKVGFDNINVDLMFGLPNQTVQEWKDALEEITSINPEHISAYSLIIEEGTPFYTMNEKDLIKLPSENEEREMYECTRKILLSKGYGQYEISNYSKKGKECFHNEVYWRCEEYLGVGVSASSYIDKNRVKNIDDIKKYIEKVKNNESIVEEIINNSLEDEMEEFMFMGLRMVEGISEEEFYNRFNQDVEKVYGQVIDNNIKKELLERNGGRIYLTEKGIELSNLVMCEMLLERE